MGAVIKRADDWLDRRPKRVLSVLAYATHGALVTFALWMLHRDNQTIPALNFWEVEVLLIILTGTRAFFEVLDDIEDK